MMILTRLSLVVNIVNPGLTAHDVLPCPDPPHVSHNRCNESTEMSGIMWFTSSFEITTTAVYIELIQHFSLILSKHVQICVSDSDMNYNVFMLSVKIVFSSFYISPG